MARRQISRGRLPRGLASAVAIAMLAGPLLGLTVTERVVHAAIVEPSADVTLEVQVDAGISDAADLRRWVDEEARQSIASWPPGPTRRGNVRIAIVGVLYDYNVTITALRDGDPMGKADVWACECSTEELLETLRGKLPKVAGWLEVVEEPAEMVEEPAAEAEPVRVEDYGRRRTRGRLGRSGAAGVVLMTAGVTGVATGVAFIVVKVRPPTDAFANREVLDLRSTGALIAGASIGLLATGLTLYMLRGRRGQRSAAIALVPSLDEHGRVALTVSGRF